MTCSISSPAIPAMLIGDDNCAIALDKVLR
jgi:hypothetical protein